jgi:hypothetical protein
MISFDRYFNCTSFGVGTLCLMLIISTPNSYTYSMYFGPFASAFTFVQSNNQ